MTAATTYRILWPPTALPDGQGTFRATSNTNADAVPMIMYGEGTPAGTLWPWTIAPKGSIWLSTNQTANAACAWVKQADNDAVADWFAMSGSSGAVQRFETQVFDMDAAANQYDYLFFPNGAEIVAAYLVFTEATDASAAAEALISAGTVADGVTLIAAVSPGVSKAVGTVTTLTVAEGTVASKIVTKNTVVAATEAGQYKVVYYVVQP